MASNLRRSLVWPAMILAGAALGGYVVTAWPDTSPQIVRLPYGEAMPKTPSLQAIRVTASVAAEPEAELAEVAGAFYPGDYYVYELSASPHLDAVIAAPQAVDAN